MKFNIMKGKRGLIVVANDRSIAWGIARFLHAIAELSSPIRVRLETRAHWPSPSVLRWSAMRCGTGDDLASVIDAIGETWGSLDFVVHSLAYSSKEELTGRYMDTSAENLSHPAYFLFFSYRNGPARPAIDGGPRRQSDHAQFLWRGAVMPSYNVMGVPKLRWRPASVIWRQISAQKIYV